MLCVNARGSARSLREPRFEKAQNLPGSLSASSFFLRVSLRGHRRQRACLLIMHVCFSSPVFDSRRLQRPPIARICAYHNPHMTWVNDSSPIRWTWRSNLFCSHCGAEIQTGDDRPAGCNSCECAVCLRLPGRHYTRYGRSRAGRSVPRIDLFAYDCYDERLIVEVTHIPFQRGYSFRRRVGWSIQYKPEFEPLDTKLP